MATPEGTTPTTKSTQDKTDQLPAASPPTTQKPTTYKAEIARIADVLVDNFQIGFMRDRPPKHRRYAVLRTLALYDKLVSIYSKLFQQNWEFLRRSIDGFTTSIGIRERQWEHAAKAYISCWFFDLYVSIRSATQKISGTAFVQYYHAPASHILHEYDAFLVHLNAIIRPTHIQLSLEDCLYIPRIATTMDISKENPFGIAIDSWNRDPDFAYSILDRMKAPGSKWRIEPLVTDVLGRPGWLLDWHTVNNESQAFAWFPNEGNFSFEDLIAPLIIGEGLTPNMGPCDIDDWQYFPNYTRPLEVKWHDQRRVTARKFRGSSEVRTYLEETVNLTYFGTAGHEASKKRKASTGISIGASASSSQQATSAEDEPREIVTDITPVDLTPATLQTLYSTKEANRFRIIDWTYCTCVIQRITPQQKDGAIRSFCFKQ